MKSARIAAGLALAAALSGSALLGGSSAPAALSPARVVDTAPGLERGAAVTSAVAPSTALNGTVVLRPRSAVSLQRFIAAASERGSPNYGRYLGPGQFAARFGPTAATVGAVEGALRAGGLRVESVSGSRMLIRFAGTAGDVQPAFGTSLRRYRLPDGRVARGTTSAVRLPAAVAGSVAAVVGLNVVAAPAPRAVPHPLPAQVSQHPAARSVAFAHPAGSPRACVAARAASVAADGLTDDQIANAYGAPGLYAQSDRGGGQRIALYENEPFLRSDIRTFDTCFFGRAQAAAMAGRLHVFAVDGGQPAGPGSGEASLDIEDVSAIAPQATIDVYDGPYTGANPNDYDSLDEYAAIVDADRDQIVSTSWGLCEQSIQQGQPGIQQAENLLFEQAAAQGQTVFAAAGDNGSDDCNTKETPLPAKGQDPLSVEDSASQPYVVAVGGTAIDDADPRAPVEQVWNGGPHPGAGGGGISESWQMPSWQRTARVPGLALPGGAVFAAADATQRSFGYSPGFCQATLPGATATTACRLLPDVSAQADEYTGSITVYSRSYAGTSFSKNGWTTTGGTSSAAPLWAATLALVNASPDCSASRTTAAGVGFLSPQLYALASDPARYRASFHDITTGDNDVDGVGGGRLYAAGTGFDLASGLGSPHLTDPEGGPGLAYYLCAGAHRAQRPVVSRLVPSSGSVTGGEHVTITGSGFATGVAAIQIGSRTLARTSFHVTSATTIAAMLPAGSATVPPAAPAPQDGAGPANVIVTTRAGVSSATGPGTRFDYVDESPTGDAATVDAIAPSGGFEQDPRPVTVLGSGFSGATGVQFGGVRATRVRVVSPDQIEVTPPALSAATACAPLPATQPFTGENAGNDICQVAVQVRTAHGASATPALAAPHEGAIAVNALGDVTLSPACGCEGVSAPDEYDYVPAPQITSISTAAGPSELASEAGTTVITLRGRGLNALALNWANVGDPRSDASVDTDYAYISGTKLEITAPAQPVTVDTRSIALTIDTLGGRSRPVNVTYAGVPRVRGVISLRDQRRLIGVSGASDAGGTAIRVTGAGFARQVTGPVEFRATGGGLSLGTDYRYRVTGSSGLVTTTVAQTPSLVDVRLCTVTGCSPVGAADRMWLYAPGDPRVTSVTPDRGPSAGGTPTIIRGANLGCPIAVFFGHRAAKSVTRGKGALDCGATELVTATSPAGASGSVAPITVFTVESFFTHHPGTTAGLFRYGP